MSDTFKEWPFVGGRGEDESSSVDGAEAWRCVGFVIVAEVGCEAEGEVGIEE